MYIYTTCIYQYVCSVVVVHDEKRSDFIDDRRSLVISEYRKLTEPWSVRQHSGSVRSVDHRKLSSIAELVP